MHQMHRRRSAHCMRTFPRGRVWEEAKPTVTTWRRSPSRPPPVSALLALCPLLPTTCNFHSLEPLSLVLHSVCQLDRGTVPTSPFQNTKRPPVRVRILSSGSDFSVAQGLQLVYAFAELRRCKPGRDGSFEDPPDLRRILLLTEASTTSVDRHGFSRSSDLSSYVHRLYPPPTPAQMRA